MDKQLLTPSEAAQLLAILVKGLHRLCQSGEIGYVRINGKERRFTSEHLEAFVASREVAPRVAQPGHNRVSSNRKGGERTKKSLKKYRAKPSGRR